LHESGTCNASVYSYYSHALVLPVTDIVMEAAVMKHFIELFLIYGGNNYSPFEVSPAIQLQWY
jgi:hypothetical protein